MAFDQVIAGGANFVARAVEFQVRQATATSSTLSTSTVPSPTSTVPSASPTTVMTTTAVMSPTPTPTDTHQNQGSSSPLLFFVALGFGVVFTNLWIIVGVKYCFRYNARNRALARLDENGDPIDLQNMPTRPHRRRREKKLMTMDEVNEKFPMVKYKTWVLERQKEGLPAAGGISSQAPSRANSVRSVEGIVPQQESEQPTDGQRTAQEPTTGATTTSPAAAVVSSKDGTADTPAATENREVSTTDEPGTAPAPDAAAGVPAAKDVHRISEDDEDDDDHINAALPPELLNSSGDTCAICIDTLEDDDDVRGLTCGHAFHAVCLDPWLTNRRACCPLCKADYYTPKVRPQPAEGEAQDPNAADSAAAHNRMNMPRAPMRSFAWSHFRDLGPRQMFPTRLAATGLSQDPGAGGQWQNRSQRDRRARPSRRTNATQTQTQTQSQEHPAASEEGGNVFTRFRNRFPPFRLDREMRQSREADRPSTTTEAPTPSQLEAGVPTTTPAH